MRSLLLAWLARVGLGALLMVFGLASADGLRPRRCMSLDRLLSSLLPALLALNRASMPGARVRLLYRRGGPPYRSGALGRLVSPRRWPLELW